MTSPSATPERIIQAAAEIFGRDGFKAATIRRIADAAGANVASINYYFGDKKGLYSTVLDHLFKSGFERFPSDIDVHINMEPKERLRGFIRGMFYRFLSTEGWNGLAGPGRLIARELLDPTPSLEAVAERYIRPQKDLLISILADIPESPKDSAKLLSCALSIIGQCIYYALAAPIIKRVAQEAVATQDNLDQLTDFVWSFSLGGLEKIGDLESRTVMQNHPKKPPNSSTI